MILADKIIRLRRKNGWSQEELAEKMNVSRQAVSKWESAQTVPDLEKILMLGALFGVTTDYLLKDELESEEFTSGEDSAIRRLRSGGEKAQPKGEGTFRCLLDARCGCVSRLELHDRGLEEHMDRLAGRGCAVRGGAASLPSVHEKPRRLSRRVFYGGERPEMD